MDGDIIFGICPVCGASGGDAAENSHLAPDYHAYENLTNGGFEVWTAGDNVAPDGWTLSGAAVTIAKESAIVKSGNYSAKLTRNGTNALLYQTITNSGGHNLASWKGKIIRIGCWVYATLANRVYFYGYDGVSGFVSSAYHQGTGWEHLSGTGTISTNATLLRIYCIVADSDISAYFDAATAIEVFTTAYCDSISNIVEKGNGVILVRYQGRLMCEVCKNRLQADAESIISAEKHAEAERFRNAVGFKRSV